MEMLLRAAIAVAVLALVAGAIYGARALQRRGLANRRGEDVRDLAERLDLRRGEPAVLYFWGERCVQCVRLQQPALDQLRRETAVRVAAVDAAADAALARRFGVLTVPSTVVIGEDLRVRDINIGFADASRLADQLRAS